jgi:hypothetical protein
VHLSLGGGPLEDCAADAHRERAAGVTGGAIGLVVAFAFTLPASLSWPALGFTFALSAASGLLRPDAGLQSTKADFTPALKEGRSQGWGRMTIDLPQVDEGQRPVSQ